MPPSHPPLPSELTRPPTNRKTSSTLLNSPKTTNASDASASAKLNGNVTANGPRENNLLCHGTRRRFTSGKSFTSIPRVDIGKEWDERAWFKLGLGLGDCANVEPTIQERSRFCRWCVEMEWSRRGHNCALTDGRKEGEVQ